MEVTALQSPGDDLQRSARPQRAADSESIWREAEGGTHGTGRYLIESAARVNRRMGLRKEAQCRYT